jgi:predicted aspartyl protease
LRQFGFFGLVGSAMGLGRFAAKGAVWPEGVVEIGEAVALRVQAVEAGWQVIDGARDSQALPQSRSRGVRAAALKSDPVDWPARSPT